MNAISQGGTYPKKYNYNNNIRDKLLEYTSSDVLSIVEKHINLNELYEVLSYIEQVYKFKPRISFSVIPDTNEFDSVDIILEDCTWKEWVKIAHETKDWLKRHNKFEIAGKVSIICLKGLQEPNP